MLPNSVTAAHEAAAIFAIIEGKKRKRPCAQDAARSGRPGLQGKSGGGLCFGYDVVRKVDTSGEGQRGINEGEALIVRRILEEFAKGRSPRATAQSLNKAGIAGPGGRSWGPSTIYDAS